MKSIFNLIYVKNLHIFLIVNFYLITHTIKQSTNKKKFINNHLLTKYKPINIKHNDNKK